MSVPTIQRPSSSKTCLPAGRLNVFDFAGLTDESGEAKDGGTLAKSDAGCRDPGLTFLNIFR